MRTATCSRPFVTSEIGHRRAELIFVPRAGSDCAHNHVQCTVASMFGSNLLLYRGFWELACGERKSHNSTVVTSMIS